MKTAHLGSIGSDYRQVMAKRSYSIQPWTLAFISMVALVLVLAVAVPSGKWAWNKIVNEVTPELRFNPHGQVVLVVEADGKTYTRDTDSHFNERVARIKKGSYVPTYTGRLDGRP